MSGQRTSVPVSHADDPSGAGCLAVLIIVLMACWVHAAAGGRPRGHAADELSAAGAGATADRCLRNIDALGLRCREVQQARARELAR